MRLPSIRVRPHQSKRSAKSFRPSLKLLEDRCVPALTDMTDLAQLFPTHAGPTTLGLNFDGWAAVPDPVIDDGKSHSISPFVPAGGNVDQAIQDILFRTAEEFAPFNVQVVRVFGNGNFLAGNGDTTLFIGDDSTNVDANGRNFSASFTPMASSDFPQGGIGPSQPNDDPFDFAFCDPVGTEQNGNPYVLGDTRIVQAIAHESGHSFGLAHIRTDGGLDPQPLGATFDPEVMSYTSENIHFSNVTWPITAFNYDPNTGKSHLETAVVPRWYEIVGNTISEHDMLTQNSYTYLTAVLGPSVPDGNSHVVSVNVDPFLSAVDQTYQDGAQPVLSSWSTTAGGIGQLGKFNVYALDVPANAPPGVPYTVAVDPAPGSTLDPVVLVYDGLGLVAFNNDVGKNNHRSQVSFQPQAGHTYSVVVGGANGASAGNYKLRTFIATIDPAGGLDVFADPAVAHNIMKLDVGLGAAQVTVNGTTAGFPTVNFGSISLNGGDGGDTINILATPLGKPVFVNGGVRSDIITVGGSTLGNIKGHLAIHGGGAIGERPNQLVLDDESSDGNRTYTLNGGSLTATGVAPVTFDGFGILDLDTGPGFKQIHVESTASSEMVRVRFGTGTNLIQVGDQKTHTLDGIAGPLSFGLLHPPAPGAKKGTNFLTYSDAGAAAGNLYDLGTAILARSGAAQISFQDIDQLRLDAGAGGNTIQVHGPLPIPVTINAGVGNDVVQVAVTSQSGFNLTVNDGKPGAPPMGQLAVVDADPAGGAVIHNHSTKPGVGAVTVHYVAGLPSKISYQGISGVAQDPSADQSFIQALYHDILQRNSTAAEIATWLPVLQGPQGRQQVAEGIEHLVHARLLIVENWYPRYFNQPKPTIGQLKTAVDFLDQHTEEETLRMLFDAEVQVGPGFVAQVQFIKDVYKLFFGPKFVVSPAEQAADVAFLATHSPGELVYQKILLSTAYRAKVIAGYYGSLLHMNPNNAQVKKLAASALDLRTIRIQLESSQDFYDRGF